MHIAVDMEESSFESYFAAVHKQGWQADYSKRRVGVKISAPLKNSAVDLHSCRESV